MTRRLVLALCVLAAGVLAVPVAGAATAATTPVKAKGKVVCHWTKVTRKHRHRRRLCVRVKVTPKAVKPATTTAPSPAPGAAPVAQAPAATPVPAPAVTPGPDVVVPPTLTDPVVPTVARVQVQTREWSVRLSRATLPAGAATVELVNAGEDGHDLHIRPAGGGADVLAVDETAPGGVVDSDLTLSAGTYTVYCSLPGHEAAGMHATLSVG